MSYWKDLSSTSKNEKQQEEKKAKKTEKKKKKTHPIQNNKGYKYIEKKKNRND